MLLCYASPVRAIGRVDEAFGVRRNGVVEVLVTPFRRFLFGGLSAMDRFGKSFLTKKTAGNFFLAEASRCGPVPFRSLCEVREVPRRTVLRCLCQRFVSAKRFRVHFRSDNEFGATRIS